LVHLITNRLKPFNKPNKER